MQEGKASEATDSMCNHVRTIPVSDCVSVLKQAGWRQVTATVHPDCPNDCRMLVIYSHAVGLEQLAVRADTTHYTRSRQGCTLVQGG